MTAAKIYRDREEAVRDLIGSNDRYNLTQHSMVLGHRFSEVTLSPLARRDLERAQLLIEWYETVLCRLEPDSDSHELRELLRT